MSGRRYHGPYYYLELTLNNGRSIIVPKEFHYIFNEQNAYNKVKIFAEQILN